MRQKKVLIVSHNPINKTDNMGKTIGNIFSKFQAEEMCQLYFRSQNIESENCKDFFCIDDVSMVKSVFNRFYKTGRIVENNTIVLEEGHKEEAFQYGRKRTGTVYMIRDLLWKLGKWNTKELSNWLNQMKPTCIFLAASDYTFPFKICMKLSKTLNIPMYIYYTDEFYRKESRNGGFLFSIYKNYYRRVFRKAINKSKTYFTITPQMLRFYENEFNKSGHILMNICNTENENSSNLDNVDNLIFRYIGNLDCGRWENIIEIGKAIEQVNIKNKSNFVFEIYSNERNNEILKKIQDCLPDSYKGSLNSREVEHKIRTSDILIHTESFRDTDINRVKFSLSTKIPDILGSGKLILVYAPETVASMQYIKQNRAGLVADSKEKLTNTLMEIYSKEIDAEQLLRNAQELTNKNHRIESIHKLLYSTLIGDNNEKEDITN